MATEANTPAPAVPAETVAAKEQAASVEGARSVAGAVSRVADAAVAEIQKTRPSGPSYDFHTTGNAGGRFEIRGSGLGTNGTVKLNGVQLHTTMWGSTEIVGELPAEAKSGILEVHVDDKTVKRGKLTL